MRKLFLYSGSIASFSFLAVGQTPADDVLEVDDYIRYLTHLQSCELVVQLNMLPMNPVPTNLPATTAPVCGDLLPRSGGPDQPSHPIFSLAFPV